MSQVAGASAPEPAYRSLYRLGGVAAWIVAFLTVAEVEAFAFFPQPSTGHGKRRSLADGATKGYLMPADARPDQWHEWIEIDSIFDSNLYEAKHVFYLLDSCYSGLAATRAPEGSSRFEQDLLTRRARQVLTAGKDHQVVADTGGEGHSIFTNSVLEGLGDSLAAQEESQMVTGFDLMRYVTRRVALDTNSLQTPDEGTRLGHRGGDFVFRLPQTFGAALSPEEHLTLGSRLYELGQQLDEISRYRSARRQFEEVLRCPNLDEGLAEQARLWIAKTFVAEGDLDSALENLEKLTNPASGTPPPEALIALAVTYAKRQEPALAIETLRWYAELHSEHRDVPWARDFIAALETDGSGRQLALLVGNDEYLSGPRLSLPGCANDVKLIARTLIEVFGFRGSDITILTGSAATRQRILNELRSLVDTMEPEDTIVFFRSGHASYLAQDEQQVGILVPYDGLGGWQGVDGRKVITDQELDAILRQKPARRKWVILDGGGGQLVAQVKRQRQYNLYVAASPGETTHEAARTAIGRAGAFTYALTEALGRGDGLLITHRELHQRTLAWMASAGYKQTPQFVAEPDEMVLSRADTAFVAAWEFAHERRAHSDSRLGSIDRLVHGGHTPYVPAERVFGKEFLDRGKFIDAAEAFERVIPSTGAPDAGDHFNLARARLGSRQFAKSVEALHAAISAEPHHDQREISRRLEGMVQQLEQDPARFALLVGVEYFGQGGWLPQLGVEADVQLMKQALIDHASFEPANIRVLMNGAATEEAILANLESMAEHDARACTLFYFAGNGLHVSPGNAVIHCPSEESTNGPGLGLAELAERVKESPNLFTIIDAAWYAEAGFAQETRRAGEGAASGSAEPRAKTAIGAVSILTQGLNPDPKTGAKSELTQELVRVLAESTATPLTYREWLDAASVRLEDPKPVVYGTHAGQPIFTDGALFEEALQLAEAIDHLRLRRPSTCSKPWSDVGD